MVLLAPMRLTKAMHKLSPAGDAPILTPNRSRNNPKQEKRPIQPENDQVCAGLRTTADAPSHGLVQISLDRESKCF